MSIFHVLLHLSLKKKAVLAIVIVLVVGFGRYQFFGQSSTTPTYQTATAQKTNIISTVSENGNIIADSQVSVNSPATGLIEEVYVKNGDTVMAGQNLFRVKAVATAAEKTSAYANYLGAQNTLNSAQAKINSLQAALYKANQTFINDKGVSNPTDLQKQDPVYMQEQANWLQAEADYKNQSGVISQAQAALQAASLNYQATQDAIVTAPIDGAVANLSVAVGSGVKASSGSNNSNSSSNSSTSSSNSSSSSSSSSSTGSTVLVLGNFSQLSVVASVNEVDIPKLQVGQKATITLDAFSDKTYVGKVTSIDSVGTASSGVVTYNVYITLIAPPSTIHSGMTASVIIQTDRRDNVVTVPLAAVQTSSGSSYVRVMKNGKVSQVDVTTGISSDTETEITSGINEGDVVVTSVSTANTKASSSTTSPFSSLGGRGFGGSSGGGAARVGR
jgi:multidrug efflux pump subunit AcrA (membrane-fusion protein)